MVKYQGGRWWATVTLYNKRDSAGGAQQAPALFPCTSVGICWYFSWGPGGPVGLTDPGGLSTGISMGRRGFTTTQVRQQLHTRPRWVSPFHLGPGWCCPPAWSLRLRGELCEPYSAAFTHQGKLLLTPGLVPPSARSLSSGTRALSRLLPQIIRYFAPS